RRLQNRAHQRCMIDEQRLEIDFLQNLRDTLGTFCIAVVNNCTLDSENTNTLRVAETHHCPPRAAIFLCRAPLFVFAPDCVAVRRQLYQAYPESPARVNCCQKFGARLRERLIVSSSKRAESENESTL